MEEEKEEEYDPDKSGAGPIKDRSCTDVLCLGLLIAFLVLWAFIAAWAFNYGDPSKLMYPTDSFGDVCGRGDFASKPYLLFFDLTKCISLSALTGCPTPQVCVAQCPGDNYSPWMESQAGNVISTSETVSSLLDTDIKTRMRPFCTADTSEEVFSSLSVAQLLDRNYCPPWWVESQQVLGRCLPSLAKHNTSDTGLAQ